MKRKMHRRKDLRVRFHNKQTSVTAYGGLQFRVCALGLSLAENQAFSGQGFSLLYSSVTVNMLPTGIANTEYHEEVMVGFLCELPRKRDERKLCRCFHENMISRILRYTA